MFFRRSPRSSFQILSDLYLEVGRQSSSFVVPPSAPYLILAGDIGRLIDYELYLEFLAKQAAQFKRIFLVLGNHEFYGLSYHAGLESAQKLENEEALNGKLVLMHQRRYDISDTETTILGCTLWSAVPASAKEVVRMRVKDFEKIEAWTVDDHNASHEADNTWLRHQTLQIQRQNESKAKGQRTTNILVVTHHAPSVQKTSSPKNVGNPWSSAFATELLGDACWSEVKAWVFGHTHFTTQFERNGIKVLSNQRGYVLPGSKEGNNKQRNGKMEFDVRKVIHV